jgi:hypothetical protein
MKKIISYFMVASVVVFSGCGGSSNDQAKPSTVKSDIENLSKSDKSMEDIGQAPTASEVAADMAEHNIENNTEHENDGISNINSQDNKQNDKLGSPGNPIPAKDEGVF